MTQVNTEGDKTYNPDGANLHNSPVTGGDSLTSVNTVTNDDVSELRDKICELMTGAKYEDLSSHDALDVDEAMQLITADREKAVKQAEEFTADIEFKAGINHVTMSGEYVTKSELAKAVLDGQIEILEKVQTIRRGEAASNNVIAYHVLEELTELQNQRKALS